jgi:hypothetical protein
MRVRLQRLTTGIIARLSCSLSISCSSPSPASQQPQPVAAAAPAAPLPPPHSHHSVTSSTRCRQEAELAAAVEHERAAAARASRLAAARAEEEAAAIADATREAAVEAEVLHGSANSSVSADGSTDADPELLDAARDRAAQWVAEHAPAHGGGAPGGGAHGGGGWPTLTKTNYVEWAAVMRIRRSRCGTCGR